MTTKKSKLETTLKSLTATLDGLSDIFKEAANTARVVQEDLQGLGKELDKEETKTGTKKATSKKVFTSDDRAKGDAELKVFNAQWKKLGMEGQEKFLKGEIDSLGKLRDDYKEEEGDGFDDLFTDPAETKWVYTLDDLREVCKTKAEKDGRVAVMDVFKQYGVKKLDELKADMYGEVISKLQI